MTNENDENNMRVIFRPTKKQYDRLQNFYIKSERYKHLSELLREILEIGLNELEERSEE